MSILTPDQETRVRAHTAEREKERQADDRDIMKLFASPVGEKVLGRMRHQTYMTRTTVELDATGQVDVNRTLLNEGSRMHQLWIEQSIARALKGE